MPIDIIDTIRRIAFLSSHVYRNDARSSPPPGYEVLDTIDAPSGLQGAVYRHVRTGDVSIVFRGTDGDGDILADLGLGLTHLPGSIGRAASLNWSKQLDDAKGFTDRWVETIRSGDPEAQIRIGGHSLGGAIAQFEGARKGLETHTFNAPGVREIVERDLPGHSDWTVFNHVRETDPLANAGFDTHFGMQIPYSDPDGRDSTLLGLESLPDVARMTPFERAAALAKGKLGEWFSDRVHGNLEEHSATGLGSDLWSGLRPKDPSALAEIARRLGVSTDTAHVATASGIVPTDGMGTVASGDTARSGAEEAQALLAGAKGSQVDAVAAGETAGQATQQAQAHEQEAQGHAQQAQAHQREAQGHAQQAQAHEREARGHAQQAQAHEQAAQAHARQAQAHEQEALAQAQQARAHEQEALTHAHQARDHEQAAQQSTDRADDSQNRSAESAGRAEEAQRSAENSARGALDQAEEAGRAAEAAAQAEQAASQALSGARRLEGEASAAAGRSGEHRDETENLRADAERLRAEIAALQDEVGRLVAQIEDATREGEEVRRTAADVARDALSAETQAQAAAARAAAYAG